ncbi:condensation domain-containing protein [Kitasatospora herbaricolor]|uniref:Condensation domain-containing protein n=1 Tax=Kitasatospora herbaricolor TaxID=68217 RepID=A0ABZ1WJ65_9ACTN|nr:condensation domain-containing protein [Kitasatospora herbaricolor]
MTRTRRITVRYSAEGGGSGPLTMGQDNMIRCIRRDDPEQINKEAVWPVPAGTELPAALAALRTLAERHASLRTVFPPGPDGFPARQEVRGEGEFTVRVVEVGPLDERELDRLADDLARTDNAVAFDLAADFPLRCTLVTAEDRPVRMAVVVCHSGADGAATALLIQEWLLLAAGKELPPATARTPLEVAAFESSALGRRRVTASLRHWERILRTGPQAVFADSRITGPPDVVSTLILRSREAAEHLAAASLRTGASPSVVLLAAFAALVAHRADQPRLVIAALSANRHRPVMADYIGTLAQDAFLSVDTGLRDLDEVIGHTKAASLAGYWHSTFDADQIWRMIDDIAHLRGSRFARHVVVNDLSLTIPESASEARPAAVADPEISWFPDQRVPVRLMFNILRVNGSLELALLACPQVLDRAEIEEFARGLLAVVRAAATGPVPLAGLDALTAVRPGVREGDWRQVDGSWIDLDAVRELLADVLGADVATTAVRNLDVANAVVPNAVVPNTDGTNADGTNTDGTIVEVTNVVAPSMAVPNVNVTNTVESNVDVTNAFVPNATVSATKVTARVELTDGRLVAHLWTGAADLEEPRLTPLTVHRALVDALPGRDTAMAPHHYVIHRGTAAGTGDRGTGEASALLEGDGRDPETAARQGQPT